VRTAEGQLPINLKN